jgi:hypothetical protein
VSYRVRSGYLKVSARERKQHTSGGMRSRDEITERQRLECQTSVRTWPAVVGKAVHCVTRAGTDEGTEQS